MFQAKFITPFDNIKNIDYIRIMQPIAVQIRRDTDAGWTSTGTILRPGEESYSTDTNILKIGDGINTWTNLPPIGAASTSSLVTENFMVAGGEQVTVGTGKSLAYSYDGLTWNSPNTNIFQNGLCRGVAWNGSTWLAGGVDLVSANALIASSPDGIRWTADVSGGTSVFKGGRYVNTFAWNGSLWVAGAIAGSITNGKSLATSADGKTWVEQTSSFIDCYTVASNGNMFVAGGIITGSSKLLAYSYDGVKWVHPPIGSIFGTSTGAVYSVAWNGLIWVACGRNDTGGSSTARIATSPDGINWTEVTLTPALNRTTLNSVAWNGYLWIATGQDYTNAPSNLGVILSSPDGTTWTNITSNLGGTNPFAQINPVAWNGSRWLIGGYDSAITPITLTSIDTITWTSVTTSMGEFLTSIAPRRLVPIGPVGPLLSLSYYLANNTGANTGPTAISVIGFDTSDPANSLTGGALYMNYDKTNGVLTNTSNITISVLVSGQVTTDNTAFDLNRIQPCLYVTKNSDNIVSSSAINFNGSAFSTVVVLKPAETVTIRYSQTLPYNALSDVSGVKFLGGQFKTRITFTQISSSGGDRSFPSIIRTSLIPDKPSTYDLGSTGLPFRSLYVTGTTVYLGSAVINATGGSINLINSNGTITIPGTGPTGPDGSSGGSQGTTIIYGTGIPDSALGDVDNTYIQGDAAIIYSKGPSSLATWEELVSPGLKEWVAVASSETGQYLVAVAGTEYIYTNNNYGDGTWAEIIVDSGNVIYLQSVACSLNGQKIVVAASSGYIYTNADYGQGTWTPSDKVQDSWKVSCSSSGNTISAISTEGLFARSENSGTSWTYTALTYGASRVDYLKIPNYENYYTAAIMPDTLYYTGDTLPGIGWTRMAPTAEYTYLKGIYMANNASIPLYFAIIKDPNPIKYTTDLGVTWEDLSSSQFVWSSIAAGGTNAVNIFAVTADDNGHIMYSKGGVSGPFETMPNPNNMEAVWSYIACDLSGGTNIAIIDSNKYIWRANVSLYINPGDSITWKSDGATATWNCVVVGGDKSVLATAINGTTDASGGLYIAGPSNNYILTFKDVGSSTNNFTSVTVCGTSANYRGAVVGIDDYVYISNDGALATWSALTDFGKHDFISVSSVADPADDAIIMLVAVDTSGNIWKSVDAGGTAPSWLITSPSPNFTSISSDQTAQKLAITDNASRITDGSGYIWLSSDDGLSWLPNYAAGANTWSCIAHIGIGLRIAAAASPGTDIYVSEDTGATWSPIGPNIKSSNWTSIVFIYDATNDTNIIAACANNTNSIFIYDGTTWTAQNPPAEKEWTCITSSLDGSRLLAGESSPGTSGSLFRYALAPPWITELNVGSVAGYTPGNSSDWESPPPTTIKEALDRLAYAMSEEVGPIL